MALRRGPADTPLETPDIVVTRIYNIQHPASRRLTSLKWDVLWVKCRQRAKLFEAVWVAHGAQRGSEGVIQAAKGLALGHPLQQVQLHQPLRWLRWLALRELNWLNNYNIWYLTL